MTHTPLQKKRILQDANFHYPHPWEEYEKCVIFILDIERSVLSNPNQRIRARALLKQIGEWNEQEECRMSL